MINVLSYWLPSYPRVLAYMLQSSGYDMSDYAAWWGRTRDFSSVMRRGSLDDTLKAQFLLRTLQLLYAFGLVAIIVFLTLGLWKMQAAFIALAVFLIVAWPAVMAFSILAVVGLGTVFVQGPKEKKIINDAIVKAGFLKGHKIAIAGSYGKTSMKEMLLAILSESFTVRATAGNKNTPIGIAEFLQTLSDDEQIVIFELGESHVGDVTRLCEIVQPKTGIITGISEAHLATFGTRQNIIDTIFELEDFLGADRVYKNADSQFMHDRLAEGDPLVYSRTGCHGWQTQDITLSLEGISFTAVKGAHIIRTKSSLIGEHHIGPLMACIDIAHRLGMQDAQIEAGIARTKPFEHRMQPYSLSGATIIDDTYNGNPSGMYSGLELLKHVSARRRVYVTPGLVELGDESDKIHESIGRKIADSADLVVLMKNSATAALRRGLEAGGYKGRLILIGDPLQFYSHLDQFVAAGDVVLMQNDWTDNYH